MDRKRRTDVSKELLNVISLMIDCLTCCQKIRKSGRHMQAGEGIYSDELNIMYDIVTRVGGGCDGGGRGGGRS